MQNLAHFTGFNTILLISW